MNEALTTEIEPVRVGTVGRQRGRRGRAEGDIRITDVERELDRALRIIATQQQQIAELASSNARLQALAALDGLTGLKNHRTFHERLKEEYERAVRYRTPLSIILLDVDHFKPFNDTYGHPAGDLVLAQIARILQENVRETDVQGRTALAASLDCVIARHGGEEFSLILPHTDGKGAMRLAERLRSAIETSAWDNRQITASFGVAWLVPGTGDLNGLIGAADKALYRSKTRGRNRVTAAPLSQASSAPTRVTSSTRRSLVLER